MKKRPILFSAPMVLALLAGKKTQTRRVVKWPDWIVPEDYDKAAWELRNNYCIALMQDGRPVKRFCCPYGVPGDRLWVREGIQAADFDGCPIQYQADGFIDWDSNWVWKRTKLSAMHCPRGMSRIKLEVTDVRIQLLQAITSTDALAEGIQSYEAAESGCKGAYRDLWNSINGPDSWDKNPWVWVVDFKRLSGTTDGKQI